MKYYSEILKKFYDDKEALVTAEKKAEEEKVVVEATKKELAEAVSKAEAKVEAAYQSYEVTRKEIQEKVDKFRKEIADEIAAAKEEVKNAEYEKVKAVQEFNKKFGTYTKVYSGDKALDEYNRTINHFNSLFDNLWKPFTWLF